MTENTDSGNTDELIEDFRSAALKLRYDGVSWKDIDQLYENVKIEDESKNPRSHMRHRKKISLLGDRLAKVENKVDHEVEKLQYKIEKLEHNLDMVELERERLDFQNKAEED